MAYRYKKYVNKHLLYSEVQSGLLLSYFVQQKVGQIWIHAHIVSLSLWSFHRNHDIRHHTDINHHSSFISHRRRWSSMKTGSDNLVASSFKRNFQKIFVEIVNLKIWHTFNGHNFVNLGIILKISRLFVNEVYIINAGNFTSLHASGCSKVFPAIVLVLSFEYRAPVFYRYCMLYVR